jgi:hypothetical protein
MVRTAVMQMFDLSQRQRAVLLAGLELLRQQPRPKRRAAGARRTPSEASIAELADLVRTGQRPLETVHQHPGERRPNRSYKIAGECTAHGSVCIACEVTYHLADGPLEWCRECDLLLATLEDPARPTPPTGRRRSQSQPRLAKKPSKAKHQL